MKSITIHVGDVYQSRINGEPSGKLLTEVITKVDSQDYFHSVVLMERCTQEALNPWGGSSRRKDIERVIDHWDAERIIQALRNGIRETSMQLWSEEMFDRLRTEMEKPSRKEKI